MSLSVYVSHMKLEEALKQDFSAMSPQQRSHLRKRALAAGLPLPRGLDLKKGQALPVEDDGTWECTVVADGRTVTYTYGKEDQDG